MAYRHKSYADKLFIRINRAILCRQGPCPHSDDSSRDELIFRGSYADKKFRLYKLVAKIRKSLTIPTRNFYLLLALKYNARRGVTDHQVFHGTVRQAYCERKRLQERVRSSQNFWPRTESVAGGGILARNHEMLKQSEVDDATMRIEVSRYCT